MTVNPFHTASFMIGAVDLKQLPGDQGREVAFAGRSNVGKSSVINAVCGKHKLARTSKTPGRTREINYFQISSMQRLVDLPGYGFAKVPVNMREHWGKVLKAYFECRLSLTGLVLIMDIRRPLLPPDRQMIAWCQTAALRTHVLLNKSDKLKSTPADKTLSTVRRQISDKNTTVQLFSALKHTGLDEVRHVIKSWLNG